MTPDPIPSVPGPSFPAAAGGHALHFQELKQGAAAGKHAITLEQRLPLKRIEVDILRERVDQIVVGNCRREAWFGAAALDRGGEHRLEPLSLLPDGRALLF